MKKIARLCAVIIVLVSLNSLCAGERTIPVDIFLMIDKSLSMDEPGKFDSLQTWVLNELVNQMLIKGDWITVYQFYEKPEHLLTTTIDDDRAKQAVYNAVRDIKPDGRFTDIGYALDTVQSLLDERGSNGRFKVLLLLSDLVQDAPWTSKYRGKQESFQSPYLVEARIISHDKWYEITLDMDIQDAVVQRTQDLYSNVLANDGLPRTQADQNKALVQGDTTVITHDSSGGTTVETTSTTSAGTTSDTATAETTTSDVTNSLIADSTTSSSDNSNNSDASNTNVSGTTEPDTQTVDGTDNAEVIDGSRAGDNSTDIVAMTSDGKDSGTVDGTGSKKNNRERKSKAHSGNSLFDTYGTAILIGAAILIVLILLIILIVRSVRASNHRKESQKEKINLEDL